MDVEGTWVVEHLAYLPGRSHVLAIETMAAALERVGIPEHKARVIAVFQWRAVQKVTKGKNRG